jgi:hypothetical protein
MRLPERPTTTEAARYALRRIAFAQDVTSPTPLDYETGREELLCRAATRSRDDEKALHERLPSSSQIVHCYGGDWDMALADAGCPPRRKGRRFEPRPGVTVPLAIAIQFAQTGALPKSPSQLRRFAAE